jgi:hypothetical protein
MLIAGCFAFGCDKEIHEAKTPLQSPALASAK